MAIYAFGISSQLFQDEYLRKAVFARNVQGLTTFYPVIRGDSCAHDRIHKPNFGMMAAVLMCDEGLDCLLASCLRYCFCRGKRARDSFVWRLDDVADFIVLCVNRGHRS